jgi:hypothetical protein
VWRERRLRSVACSSAQQKHAAFLSESVLDWLPTLEAGFTADGVDRATARALATLTLAIVRGLLQDRNAVGDHQRVRAAFDRYIVLLQAARGRQTAPRSP